MRKTPLYDEHVELGAQMVDFHGWLMPIQYSSLTEEHHAVRNEVGMFDVSHMGEIRVKGQDAKAYVKHVFTNNIDSLHDNQVIYGFLLNQEGGVVDDLLIYKYSEDDYLLVVNGSNIEKDYEWLKKQVGEFQVEVINESDEVAEIALQGPKAEEVLQSLTTSPLSEITFFTFKEDIDIDGEKYMVSRTGYTGEDGFEIYGRAETIVKLWKTFLEKGVTPAGLGCRDTLRFEAALPLYGNELDDKHTPVESGFGFFVDKEGEFIGSEVVKKQRAEGLPTKIVGLEIVDKGVVRQGYPVFNEDQKQVGEITTGYSSPTLGKVIANARIDGEYADEKTFLVGVRKRFLKANVIPKRFLGKKK